MNPSSIKDNIAKVRQRVELSAKKCQRPAANILLLAVSKTRPAGDIREAHHCGLSEFGESYLQEAVDKIDQLQDLSLCWHFIGPIQSNKTRPVAEHFHWVHSVERVKIARRLNEQRPHELGPLNVCIQVNTSGEASKSGAPLEEVPELAAQIAQMPNLKLRGLMSIPASSDDPAAQRRAFSQLRECFEQLQLEHTGLDTLSMGMSGDMEAAVAEGSTILRIGTAIFGPRNG
ncbi:YggS family pyridoxal phosphate-dependent enzyme [Halioglobus maricola]|uniref:Pyridoxal phosphate homeostasis protein n=1 Tax=Halioglobus maricola TaxID=2601894 RepID=A0A5P9NQ40_9GAMM|nr:YggS family pyridoxal phosphate-dependent enzyme [Halioglobus maricola]QFU77606.1 YggS family pyridoxal phosphate-dependent enzyme [Halioglobus maricola]